MTNPTSTTVKAISEFTLKPGRRDEFVRLFDALVSKHFDTIRAAGCHSAVIYVVPGEPDRAVEVAEWDSAAAREAMARSAAMAAFAPLFELVAAPPRATVIERPR